jgi:hypothetical protein
MSNPKFQLDGVDTGFCRVDYKVQNDKGEWIFYCIQEEFKNVCEFYRSTVEQEPQSPAKVKEGMSIDIETPKGDNELEIAVRNYINNHPQMNGY